MHTNKNLKKIIESLNSNSCEVFLSYRSTHVEFAHRLFKELKENNHIETWFDKDVLHENVGNLYPNLIHQAIKTAKIFLFLYSKDTEESSFIINDEVGYAIREYANKKDKNILCYPIDTPDFNSMDPVLSQYIREREWINKDKEAAHCLGIQEEVEGEYLRLQKAQLTGTSMAPTSIYTDKNLYLIRIQVQKTLGLSTTIGNYEMISNSGDNGSHYQGSELSLNLLPLSFKIAIPSDKIEKLTLLRFFTPIQKDNDKQAEEKIKMKDEIDNLLSRINPDEHEIENNLINFIESKYDILEIYDWLYQHEQSYIPRGLSREKFTAKLFLDIVANITADWFIYEKDQLKKGHFNGAMTGVYEVMEDPIPNIERHQTTINLYYSDYFTFRCMERVFHILCTIKDCFEEIHRTSVKTFSPFFCSLGMGGFVVTNRSNSLGLVWIKRGKAIAASDLWHFSYDETSNIYKDCERDENGTIKIFDEKTIKLNPEKYLLRGLDEEVGIKENMVKGKYGVLELGLIKCDRLEMELLSYAILDCPEEPSLPQQFAALRRGATDAHNEIAKMDFVPLISSTYKYTGRFLTPESHSLSQFLNDKLSSFEQIKPYCHISDNIITGTNIKIGKGCLIEDNCQIGNNSIIGEKCRIHRNVFIDNNVSIGNYVKIQNNNSIYEGVTLDDGVFIGTNVSFINDKYPRAILKNGEQVQPGDWKREKTHVCYGASIGSGAVIMCGVNIGKWAMVAAGSVVLEDVPEGVMVAGNPAKPIKEKIKY